MYVHPALYKYKTGSYVAYLTSYLVHVPLSTLKLVYGSFIQVYSWRLPCTIVLVQGTRVHVQVHRTSNLRTMYYYVLITIVDLV